MQHGLSSSASKRVTSSPVFARSSGTSWPVGGYRNCGKRGGGGGGGSDMNNRLTGGERGSFWGSRTCALDDALYHVRGCFLLLLIVLILNFIHHQIEGGGGGLGGVRTPPTPPPPPPPFLPLWSVSCRTIGYSVAQPLHNRASGCSTGRSVALRYASGRC